MATLTAEEVRKAIDTRAPLAEPIGRAESEKYLRMVIREMAAPLAAPLSDAGYYPDHPEQLATELAWLREHGGNGGEVWSMEVTPDQARILEPIYRRTMALAEARAKEAIIATLVEGCLEFAAAAPDAPRAVPEKAAPA